MLFRFLPPDVGWQTDLEAAHAGRLHWKVTLANPRTNEVLDDNKQSIIVYKSICFFVVSFFLALMLC